jgi:hypothetical protein
MLTAAFTLSACSGGGDDDNGTNASSASDAGGGDNAAAPEAPADAESRELSSLDGKAFNSVSDTQLEPTNPQDMERAIISKGNVQMKSDDVEKTVFDVVAIVDKYAGEITDRETGTDDEGEVRMARLVLRIPAADYSKAFDALEKAGDLISSNSTSEDVTTQIIDIDARIRAQRASLSRVEVLLDRAESIRDIVAIESQLTRRQADLDSLVKRQAYLRDQTSMSTVTVNVQRTADVPAQKKQKDDDDAGFLTGLDNGLKWLIGFVIILATVVGVLLPWAVALLVVGWPLLLLSRRFNWRRRFPSTASDTDAG